MIALDTSILVGIMRHEPDVLHLVEVLMMEPVALCAPGLVEARIWAARNQRQKVNPWLEALTLRPNVRLDAFTPAMADAAADAFRRFGRGSGHPAALNFGDALVYGHAAVAGLPLLCKGADFRLTDLPLDARAPA